MGLCQLSAGRFVGVLAAVALGAALIWVGRGTVRAQAKAAGAIAVRGATLLRDGQPWAPKGVSIIARTSPAQIPRGAYRTARQRFGADELAMARKVFGADTIRLQVSQPGLDPQAPIYSAAYAAEVGDAVRLARSLGFAVIVAMDWEGPSGLKNQPGMPSAATVRAWQTLCPALKDDRGTMLELLNEPKEPATPPAIARWHQGMQAIVDRLRACGAGNVLLLDGLLWGRITDPLPLPHDGTGQLAFAVHPYFFPSFTTPASWDRAFGRRARSVATVATEWNGTALYGCVPDLPQVARTLLVYLKARGIGLIVWAMDYPGALFRDSGSATLTSYRDFRLCRQNAPVGAGELFRAWTPATGRR